MYINGVQQTLTTSTAIANVDHMVNATNTHSIGRYWGAGNHFDGCMTEINFIDGQALDPTYFGEYNEDTGVWQPIKYTGTYGTNGFYLNFSDNTSTTTLGYDTSGNGNNWTANNISVTSGVTYDSMTDVPTLTSEDAANYATLNPLDAKGTATLSDANLTIASATTAHKNRKATFLIPSTGKWYWELTTASTCSSTVILGWGLQTISAATDSQCGNANTWMAQNDANQDIFNQTTGVLSTGGAVAGGSIRQVAYDSDTGKLWFGINNTWYSSTDLTSGNPSAGTNQCMTLSAGEYFPAITCYNLTANANFGQRPFAYTPPTDFKSLNTYNLPDSTIEDGGEYFHTVTYTGNGTAIGSGGLTISSLDFQPDLVWVKGRNVAYSHNLYDAVRGATKKLSSDATTAENTQTEGVTSFTSDGFTLGNLANVNENTKTYVAWNWKANGSGVTNNEGTIESTVSANTTTGFSIATFTGNGTAGATVGHGLNDAPSMVIAKSRNNETNWYVYHSALGGTKGLILNVTNGASTSSVYWNNTNTSSTVVTFGVGDPNNSGSTSVMYCFADVEGYSKFGSYTGNGSADGPFVYTGFRPAFVLRKRTDASWRWMINDAARSDYNVSDDALFPNYANAEEVSVTNWGIDFLSNGFKVRSTDIESNASGGTYIYMAFAENPFKNALAR
jgi:hypothetical protein